MATLDFSTLPLVEKPLHAPPLEDVARVLSEGLCSTFESVSVSVVDSPDLTQQPFMLTSPGFGGRPTIVELGGVPFLVPLVQRDRLYELRDLLRRLCRDPAFLAGAGAGPWPVPGVNCEGIINLSVRGTQVSQGSRIVTVEPRGVRRGEGAPHQQLLAPSETRVALMGNYVLSDGLPGKVIKVVCKKRIGKDNFVTAIRETLKAHYKHQVVGLGGTFLLKEGRSKQHVMPDFSETPIETEEQNEQWLHFFEMRAPLVHLGTLVTGDLGLDLRVQHFHCFSEHGEGGHYHYDTTPDSVEYEGYFVVGESIVRIDAPASTHSVGR